MLVNIHTDASTQVCKQAAIRAAWKVNVDASTLPGCLEPVGNEACAITLGSMWETSGAAVAKPVEPVGDGQWIASWAVPVSITSIVVDPR